MDQKTAAALRAPFKPEQIGKLPKVTCKDCSDPKVQCSRHERKTCRTCKAYISTKHVHIDYVGHAHVRERLIEVDPDWNWEPFALNGMGLPALDDNGGLWIWLTVGGKPMIGYGDAPGKRAAVKELIGDALRNAAQSFGVALDLWKKEAPEPVAADTERPPAEQATLTPAQRCAELRKLILAAGKKLGRDLDRVVADYAKHSDGGEISTEQVPSKLDRFLAELTETLRLQLAIKGIGTSAGKSAKQIAGDFFEWSTGTELTNASPAVLAEYKAHLERSPA
jgi:hypothetical protein